MVACADLGTLEVDDNYGLKGLRLSIAHVGAIAPLFYGTDGGGCQGGVSVDEPYTFDLARFVHYFLQKNCSFGSRSARLSGIFWRDAVSQTLLRTFGREDDRATLSGQRNIGRRRRSRVFLCDGRFAVGGFACFKLGVSRRRSGGASGSERG